MNHRDHTFAVALIASLLLHVAIVFVVADEAVRRRDASTRVVATAARPPEEVPYLVRTPPRRMEKLLFGDANGVGEAANARRGEEPMVGRDAEQTQAFLSRDPVGPGDIFKEPSMSVLPTGSAAMSPLRDAPPPPPAPPRVPFGVADRLEQWSVPHVTRAAAQVAPPAAGDDAPGSAGVARPAADPAVMSDSESDPFTRGDGAVEFRDGRVEARLGRKVKTIRPHLSLSSRFDLMGMQFPRMIVRVHVHGDGSVRRVDIVKSSGSAGADQDVKVALYQWWFEPTRENVVQFAVTWR
ncbi:MAG: hypothetical protein QOF78_1651 [Phycisphaerales bacterium]|jgi:TonB family protein|nr:hypothetical protein [Phycisphaerales bacterium]